MEKRIKKKRTKKVKREGEGTDKRGESEKRERERKKKLFFCKIYENRTLGFSRSKMQSWFTHRELRVGTKILEFH